LVCPKCGSQLPEKAKFCHECGHSVSAESGAEAPDVSLGGLQTLAGGTGAPVPSPVDASLGGLKTMTGAETGKGGAGSADDGIPLSERYEVKEEIGRGGFAVVHLGRDLRLDRPVAIKRLLPEAAAGPHGARTIERFEREAQAIASLNHRNVVAVHDTDRDAEGRYIVMEYVEGGTLRDHLKENGALPVPQAVALVVGICRGLASAHRKGVVHRDVKPANILLSRDEGKLLPKLTDFGLARAGGGSDVSVTGFGMGTPFYMAPEQRRDAKGVNHTADIYSVGKTLYELVTGQVPENVDPGEIPPPPELAEIIFRCIRTKPEERYFSVEDLIRDLETLPDPDAAVPTRPSGTGGANPCPQCGAENPVASLFCVSCGSGMSRDCPECGAKNSVNLTFCGQCGTDVEAFATIAEALARIAEHRGKKRWSRVVKELEALPADPKLPGEKGAKLLDKAQAITRQAWEALDRITEVEAEIGAAIEGQRFADALGGMDRHAELAPGHPAMAELRSQVEDARHLDELRRARDEVRGLVERKEHGKAKAAALFAVDSVGAVRQQEKPSPLLRNEDGSSCPATASSLGDEISALIKAIRKAEKEVTRLLATAQSDVSEGRFEAALAKLQAADGISPGRTDVAEAICGAQEQIRSERADLQRLRDLVGVVAKLLESRRLAQAKKTIGQAQTLAADRSVHPDERVHDEWKRLLERLAEHSADFVAREKQGAALFAAAKKAVLEGRFEAAMGSLRDAEAIDSCPQNRVGLARMARDGIAEERAAVDALTSRLSSLSRYLEGHNLAEARRELDRATAHVEHGTMAPEESLHGDWRALQERLEALEADLRGRESVTAALVASFSERLSAGAFVDAERTIREIDGVDPRRAVRDHLPRTLGFARLRRKLRRAALASAALAILVAIGVLIGFEMRFRSRVRAFNSAVEAQQVDDAVRVAGLIERRCIPAREYLAEHWRGIYDQEVAAGRKALAAGDWRVATTRFSAALSARGYTEDRAALSGRKDAQLGNALEQARAAKAKKDWAGVVAAADKVLVLDAGNREALVLKQEGETNLVPTWRPVAILGDREVPATVTIGNRTIVSPKPIRLEEGRGYTAEFAYEWEGRHYRAGPFAVTANWRGEREARAKLAEYLGPVPGRDACLKRLDIALVWCPPVTFRMGSTTDQQDAAVRGSTDVKREWLSGEKLHNVTLTKGFWLGKYEVTQRQWQAVMESNPSHFKNASPSAPVECVSWNDAAVFCRNLTAIERLHGRLPTGYGYCLPTETQWEYAARGGPQSLGFTYAGSDTLEEVAWHEGNSLRSTHPVGRKKSNELGLYDMSGNVWEWCQDWRGEYPGGTVIDPEGPDSGGARVFRGGGWNSSAVPCRAAFRDARTPTYSRNSLGFRVALAAPVQ
jgi:formylglycine-generating enzyme required for sulfatase activity/ribosomal protein L40E